MLHYEFHQNFLLVTYLPCSVFLLKVPFLIPNGNQNGTIPGSTLTHQFQGKLAKSSQPSLRLARHLGHANVGKQTITQFLGNSCFWKLSFHWRKFCPISTIFLESDWWSSYCLQQPHIVTVRLTSPQKSHLPKCVCSKCQGNSFQPFSVTRYTGKPKKS